MAIVSTFPRSIETLDPVFIPLKNGLSLAATIWRPKDAGENPVPVVLEAVPYRRRDGTVFRDRDMAPYIAGHGFAYLRLDIRGSGDSEGLLTDEYTEEELDDLCQVIEWAAAQPWSSGKVGMSGISWGGFNALQVAAKRPPALKAIISLCASDDRYADDVHYFGGCLLTEDAMWSAYMLILQTLPPDPASVGERWRGMWLERLKANRSWSERWLKHQARDEYWQRASVCEDFSKIEIPVYAISGWEDTYSDAVPRLLAGLKSPCKGLIGPWTHGYPCRGSPGPLIGYLQEAIRWWRHWLKGEETGIMDEPQLRLWLMDPEEPKAFYASHPGRWIAEEAWPSPRIRQEVLFLGDRRLEEAPKSGSRLLIASPVTTGAFSGRYGGYGGTSPDIAGDQRSEDQLALSFDSAPLTSALDLVGRPEVILEGLIADAPRVNLTARLCSVAPDGSSKMITWGALNLTQRESREAPSALTPGKGFSARIELRMLARRVPVGHRLRLALSSEFWPILWPQPFAGQLTLESGKACLILPTRQASPLDASLAPFAPVETAPPVPSETLREGDDKRVVSFDVASGEQRIHLKGDGGVTRLSETGTVVSTISDDRFVIRDGDPLSARLKSHWQKRFRLGGHQIDGIATTRLKSDSENFHLSWQWTAREDGREVASDQALLQIPRRWV